MDKMQKMDFIQSVESYLNEHQVYELFEDIIRQVVVSRPADPMQFILKKIKYREARQTICFLECSKTLLGAAIVEPSGAAPPSFQSEQPHRQLTSAPPFTAGRPGPLVSRGSLPLPSSFKPQSRSHHPLFPAARQAKHALRLDFSR